MKKYLLILIPIILIVISNINITVENKSVIKANFVKAVNHLNKSELWVNWYSKLKENNKIVEAKEDFKNKKITFNIKSDTIIVKKNSPTIVQVLNTNLPSNNIDFAIAYKSINEITAFERISIPIYKKIYYQFFQKQKLFVLSNDLKKFLENQDEMYGYRIRETKVPDTSFIILTKTILKTQKISAAKMMIDSCLSLAKKNNVKVKNGIYLSYQNILSDSLQLSTMIPIFGNEKIHNETYFLEMPKNGKMLYAPYKGNYSNISDIYNSFRNYAEDKKLNDIFNPFERFESTDFIKSNNEMVSINVFFPYF